MENSKLCVTQLRILDYYEQMGIDVPSPSFSWKAASPKRGDCQSAYEINVVDSVTKELMWNSGKVYSSRQYDVRYMGKPLQSCREYIWNVKLWDGNGLCSDTSESKRFVTGFIHYEWSAKWIGNKTLKPFYARREVDIKGEVKKAFAFVSGLGQFKMYINGEKIGDHELDPGWSDYDEQIQYVTFDVTKNIRRGPNAIGFYVGNGWYSKDGGDRHFYIDYPPYGDMLPLIAEIHIEYTDGTAEKLLTDKNWRVRAGALTLANVYGSEDYDANLYPKGWNETFFDENADNIGPWENAEIASVPKGRLTPMFQPPVKVKGIYPTVNVTQYDGRLLFDLGQNMSGMFEVFVKGPKGARIRITPVEKLSGGRADKTCNTYSLYTLSGDPNGESRKPDFSYAGGRWVEIAGENCNLTLNEAESDVKVYVKDVKGHFVTSSAEDTGRAHFSDERYNEVYRLILRAAESNLNHVHTDCPTIEKMGWLETSHLMQSSLSYLKDTRELWQKIVRDTKEAQHSDGMIPTVAPAYNGMEFSGYFGDSPVWSATNILSPSINHMNYGDEKTMAENYASMKKHIGYVLSKLDSNGFLNYGLGDWGTPFDRDTNATPENIDTAYFYHELISMADTAKYLGKNDDAEEYLSLAESVRDNYNTKLLVKDEETGNYYYKAFDEDNLIKKLGSRVAQALQAAPLFFGMVPADKHSSVLASLYGALERDGRILSGEVGLAPIIQVLVQNGRFDLLHRLIIGKKHPSYHRFALYGETSLPEFWDDAARSRNHDMMGHIMEYFYSGLGGIKPIAPGYERIMLCPAVNGFLSCADVSYESVVGSIKSKWTLFEDGITMEVSVPPNSIGEVYLPMLGENTVMVEGKSVLYADGAASDAEHIRFLREDVTAGGRQRLVFELASGKYVFEIKGEDIRECACV